MKFIHITLNIILNFSDQSIFDEPNVTLTKDPGVKLNNAGKLIIKIFIFNDHIHIQTQNLLSCNTCFN